MGSNEMLTRDRKQTVLINGKQKMRSQATYVRFQVVERNEYNQVMRDTKRFRQHNIPSYQYFCSTTNILTLKENI